MEKLALEQGLLQGFKHLSVLLKDKDPTKGQVGNKGLGTSLIYTMQLRFRKILTFHMNGTGEG